MSAPEPQTPSDQEGVEEILARLAWHEVQCPACRTEFLLDQIEKYLGAALGKLKCGECGHVFEFQTGREE
jgi:predicted Zn finger-like uncharacterized protein